VELSDVIAATLQMGCGVDLNEITCSDRFQAAVSERARLTDGPDPYLATLVEYVGDALLTAALDCLPKSVAECIGEFSTLDADGQIRLIEKVFEAFREAAGLCPKPAEEPAGDDVSFALPEGWLRRFTQEYSAQMVLPRQYGALGRACLSKPTCLGMCLMLAAFARATGSPFLMVNPLRDANRIIIETRGQLGQSILDHLDQVGTERNDFRAAMLRDVAKAEAIGGSVEDFHYSVVIRVADGRWIQLDPYMGKWGMLSPVWGMDAIYRRFRESSQSQPGAVLSSDDGGALQAWCDEWTERFNTVIHQVESLLQLLREVPVDIYLETSEDSDEDDLTWDDSFDLEPHDIVEALTSALDELMALLLSLEGAEEEALALDPMGPSYLAHFNALGLHEEMMRLTAPEGAPEHAEQRARLGLVFESGLAQFRDDPDFRRQYFENLSLWFIRDILGCWNRVYGEEKHKLLDPVMQFGLPEFGLGLAVISHVRAWSFPVVPGRMLLRLSSNQIIWHEAVDLSRGLAASEADHPEVLAAEMAVRHLPHTHAACFNKLRYLDRARSERTHSGQGEEAEPQRAGRSARGAARR
jgi:hypothetical protein